MRPPLVGQGPGIGGINITPIIDVALVLVIILLITAPVMSLSDRAIDLPAARVPGLREPERIAVSVTRTGAVSLADRMVAPGQLVAALRDRLAASADTDPLVVLRADVTVPFARIDALLEALREAGAPRIAVATSLDGNGMAWTATH